MATDTNGITAEKVLAEAVAKYGEDNVGAEELGEVYEAMQAGAARAEGGVWYTPEPVAQFMTAFSLEIALKQVGPEAHQVFRVTALDPACGCGIFLVKAARFLSIHYAARLVGGEPSGDLVLAVMPTVILNCVFGVDIDPVSAELARIALWLETARTLPAAALERHVIAGDTLAGASPPALDERRGRTEGP